MMRFVRTAPLLLALSAPLMARSVTAQTARDSARRIADIPPKLGTLNTETVTLRLRSTSLEISFIPLNEQLIRLLAPNSYASYHSLLEGLRARIDSVAVQNGIQEPGVALVNFHALAPSTRFDPQLLTLTVHGQSFHPVGVVPMSGTFANQQLDTGGATSALFIFSRALPVTESFTVTYREGVSDDWERRLSQLNSERARILGRLRTPADTMHHD